MRPLSRLQRLRNLRNARGFTLVELMIVVAIIGVLAALAIYGVSKYLGAAKSTEAKASLGAIGKGNIAAFNREYMSGAVLADAATAARSTQICGSAAATVPSAIANVTGKKYQSSAAEWAVDSIAGVGGGPKGFACLKFTLDSPHYYMYNYVGNGIDTATATFTATATGDVDGDALTSLFELEGATRDGRVVLAPTIKETNAEE